MREDAVAPVQGFAASIGIWEVCLRLVIGLFALVVTALSNTLSLGSVGYFNSDELVKSSLLLTPYH